MWETHDGYPIGQPPYTSTANPTPKFSGSQPFIDPLIYSVSSKPGWISVDLQLACVGPDSTILLCDRVDTSVPVKITRVTPVKLDGDHVIIRFSGENRIPGSWVQLRSLQGLGYSTTRVSCPSSPSQDASGCDSFDLLFFHSDRTQF